MPVRFDAVLFDLDGTLIDSREDLTAAVNHVRASLGMPALPLPVVETYVGDGVRLLLERSLETTDASAIDRALAVMRPYYLAHCLDRTTLYPGISALLDALAAIPGLRLGVVSNKPERPSERVLSGLGVRDRFAAVVGGDSTPARKPDPAPFRLALERAGVQGRRVLMVGDGPNDVHGARAAGLASCGVTWGFGGADRIRESRPDHLVTTPDAIRQVVAG